MLTGIKPRHIIMVVAFILGFSISMNLLLYFEGYYKKASKDVQDLIGPSSAVYQINRSMFPMILETTEGPIRIPIEGRINVFVPQYVNCPDICHIESMIMTYVMEKSIQEGFNDRIAWVTVEVDPWSTNESAVREYMESVAGDKLERGVLWVWVTEKGEKLEKLWGQLGIRAQKDPYTGLVGHTAGFYIVDGDTGMILYYIKPNTVPGSNAWEKPYDVAQGLYRLLKEMASRD